ncbi:hypothetical protein [Altericista sp. CCNU0014]|uniref:hypothetical protein n=1 Tax=Altericista sp. CCNU0014 TaxID=3082949 RepID=UPI00384FDEE0
MMTLKNSAENPDKKNVQSTKLLSLVSNKLHLNETLQKVLPLELQEQPELYRLVIEYCELTYKSQLTEIDLERVNEIYELAEYDEVLDRWISKIDDSVDPIVFAIRQQERISLLDFITEMRCIDSQYMTLEKFKSLAEKLELNNYFINKYVHFQDRDYTCQLVCQTSNCSITVISWKTNQRTQAHFNASDLSVIYVYQGTLTYTIFDKVNEPYIHHKGREGKQLKYLKREENQFKENTWLSINSGETYQLSNLASEDLITLHFRYYTYPTYQEDEKLAVVTPSI